jgi:hypothetical protein
MEYQLTDDFIRKKIKQYEKSHRIIHRPEQIDKLFWCFYIMKYGFFKYTIDAYTNEYTTVQTEKFAAIELFHRSKQILRTHKLYASNLETTLSKSVDVTVFCAMCLCNNMNVIYINNKCYHEILADPVNPNVVHVVRKEKESHTCELNIERSKVIIDSLFKVEIHQGLDNPLFPISRYKVTELREIYEKLNIANNITAKTAKLDIYNFILAHVTKKKEE